VGLLKCGISKASIARGEEKVAIAKGTPMRTDHSRDETILSVRKEQEVAMAQLYDKTEGRNEEKVSSLHRATLNTGFIRTLLGTLPAEDTLEV